MSNHEKLEIFLDRLGENTNNFYNISSIIKWILDEAKRKRKLFPFWKKKILFSYVSFNKKKHKNLSTKIKKSKKSAKKSVKPSDILKYFYHDDVISNDKLISAENLNKVIPKEEKFRSMKFFRIKFDEIFRYFFTEIFPFHSDSLIYLKNETMSISQDLMVTYIYKFDKNEVQAFRDFNRKYKIQEPVSKIIEFFFAASIFGMGVLVREVIKDNFQVEMICGKVNENEDNDNKYIKNEVENEAENEDEKLHKDEKNIENIEFVISIRRREQILKEFYLRSELFHFSEIFSQIPMDIKNKLRTANDLVYLLALKRYYSINKHLIALLFRIHIKCVKLQHITPILDFMNFVFSRVEDSVFTTYELLDEFLQKMNIEDKKKEAFSHLFKFCDENSGLFSTFQSNNKSQVKEQYTLLLFYIQHFFGVGFKVLYNEDRLFLKDLYRVHFQNLLEKNKNYKKYTEFFEIFFQNAFFIFLNPAIDVLFKNIFGESLEDINEQFFTVFVSSLNVKFFNELASINEILEKPIKYEEFIDFLIKVLYFVINKIFLKDDPIKASKNFRDRIGRYSPKRLALRTLELLMFKENPLSDNTWQNYDMSKNKQKVINFFKQHLIIPDDYFFSKKKLLHIVMMYQYSLDKSMLLEEWLIKKIIEPFFQFIDELIQKLQSKIQSENISDPKNIKKELDNIIHVQISKSIIDEQTKENLEMIHEWMSSIFISKIMDFIKEKTIIESL